MTRLILIRHGETDWNTEGRLQGQSADRPLSDRGQAQVRGLRGSVRHFGPAHVLASSLCRARQTADLLGYPDVETDARLAEADLGHWSGRLIADLKAECGAEYDAWRNGTFTPPGGESVGALSTRVMAVITRCVLHGGTWLIITHGGPIRAVCSEYLGLGAHQIIPVQPASLTVLRFDPQPRLEIFNYARLGPEVQGL